jgi:DNA invertase Pin-like site-specific DNA recombinase
MFITLLGSIAELERSFIVERIKAGMRRRKLEGLRLGRVPLEIDHEALVHDRLNGMSLTKVAAIPPTSNRSQKQPVWREGEKCK